ncbi:hypothetical protein P0Y31_09645 [Knoellia sp. 3-2P3]|nr:hypothetical protein [Knoellia sp. 3-2P3]MDF2092607.1 hypothetical protein [Knoellia sp. 3-2P3]
MSRHLVDVLDARDIGDARSAINRMSLRQNDWTLGGCCQAALALRLRGA